jgi:cytochrome c peroxidase
MDRGCAGCHHGALLGGNTLHRFGVAQDYWLATGSDVVDTGRQAITQNVAKTAPHFHDGSVATLDGAVRAMAALQLGQTLTDHEVGSIVAFLESLTGDVPVHYAPPRE